MDLRMLEESLLELSHGSGKKESTGLDFTMIATKGNSMSRVGKRNLRDLARPPKLRHLLQAMYFDWIELLVAKPQPGPLKMH